jgi:DNA (cytosine-5)-methyltransferase 1
MTRLPLGVNDQGVEWGNKEIPSATAIYSKGRDFALGLGGRPSLGKLHLVDRASLLSQATINAPFSQAPSFATKFAPHPLDMGWTAMSLFSGCGGLDLGFHQEGIRTDRAFEIDQTALRNYDCNLLAVGCQADLSCVFPADMPIDVLLAGAPCQGFSTVGRRDLLDPRNLLLMRAAEIALTMRPKVVILENVPAALSGAHRTHWEGVEDRMRLGGYNVRRVLLRGEDVGIAQRRRRLFLVCWLGSDCIRVDIPPTRALVLAEALAGLPIANDEDRFLPESSSHFKIAQRIGPGQKLSNVRLSEKSIATWLIPEVFGPTSGFERKVLTAVTKLRRRQRIREFGDGDPVSEDRIATEMECDVSSSVARLIEGGYLRIVGDKIDLRHTYNGKYRRLDWNSVSPTVDTHFGNPALFLHPDQHRGVTPIEAARIQGFPDHFQFLGSRQQKFKMIGNAVPPPMAASLAAFIRDAILKA